VGADIRIFTLNIGCSVDMPCTVDTKLQRRIIWIMDSMLEEIFRAMSRHFCSSAAMVLFQGKGKVFCELAYAVKLLRIPKLLPLLGVNDWIYALPHYFPRPSSIPSLAISDFVAWKLLSVFSAMSARRGSLLARLIMIEVNASVVTHFELL